MICYGRNLWDEIETIKDSMFSDLVGLLCGPLLIAQRERSKNRTGYLETTQMRRTNKVRLAVCSKAIVQRECLVFVFCSSLNGYN